MDSNISTGPPQSGSIEESELPLHAVVYAESADQVAVVRRHLLELLSTLDELTDVTKTNDIVLAPLAAMAAGPPPPANVNPQVAQILKVESHPFYGLLPLADVYDGRARAGGEGRGDNPLPAAGVSGEGKHVVRESLRTVEFEFGEGMGELVAVVGEWAGRISFLVHAPDCPEKGSLYSFSGARSRLYGNVRLLGYVRTQVVCSRSRGLFTGAIRYHIFTAGATRYPIGLFPVFSVLIFSYDPFPILDTTDTHLCRQLNFSTYPNKVPTPPSSLSRFLLHQTRAVHVPDPARAPRGRFWC